MTDSIRLSLLRTIARFERVPCRQIAILFAVAALAACSSNGMLSRHSAREVSLAAFSQAADDASPSTQASASEDESGNPDAEGARHTAQNAGDPSTSPQFPLGAAGPVIEPNGNVGLSDILDSAALASRLPQKSVAPGDRVIIDAMVGQVNGKPLFADAFLKPIEDRLIAEARQSPPAEFRQRAANIVRSHFFTTIKESLFLAEAEANLSTEERQGLRYLLSYLDERTTAQRGTGVREWAEESLQREEGVSLEQYVQGLRDQELIHKLLREKIFPKAIVSWRDIEQEYHRRSSEFNPPAVITLARIQLDTAAQRELIEQVNERLANGETIVEIAATIESGGDPSWRNFQLTDEGITGLSEAMRTHTGNLRNVGDSTGPFELGSSTWWLAIAERNQPRARSLYDQDVQRTLAAAIRNARINEAEDAYFYSLIEKAIVDDMNEMADRLLQIALVRYSP